jgi:hypothetical protein
MAHGQIIGSIEVNDRRNFHHYLFEISATAKNRNRTTTTPPTNTSENVILSSFYSN